MCNKIAYDSKAHAKEVLKSTNRNSGNRTGKVSYYQCTLCGYWHTLQMNKRLNKKITSSNKRKYRRYRDGEE